MIVCSSDAAITYDRIMRRNPNWGYRKVLAALRDMGFQVSERQVRKALKIRRTR